MAIQLMYEKCFKNHMAISGNKQFNTIIEFLKESKVWPLQDYHALPTSRSMGLKQLTHMGKKMMLIRILVEACMELTCLEFF
jgi:hypothetical protein